MVTGKASFPRPWKLGCQGRGGNPREMVGIPQVYSQVSGSPLQRERGLLRKSRGEDDLSG